MAEVVLVRWPEDGSEGLRLAGAGVAVLYLVTGDEDPPRPTTCLEDWVRVPGNDRDLSARVAALELRSRLHLSPPTVDADGRLHYRGTTLVLPAPEAGIARLLTERFGEVVPDGEFPAEARDSLRRQVAQLRARFRDLGLSLSRVRRRGYVLRGR